METGSRKYSRQMGQEASLGSSAVGLGAAMGPLDASRETAAAFIFLRARERRFSSCRPQGWAEPELSLGGKGESG